MMLAIIIPNKIPIVNVVEEIIIMSFFVYKKSRPFCRIFIFLLAIILSFNFICKPKRVYAGGLSATQIVNIIGILAGVVFGGYQVGTDLYDRVKGKLDPDFETYFNNEISVDGSGNYVISDAGMVTINAMAEEAKKSGTFSYGYFPKSGNLGSEGFYTKSARDVCVSLIQGSPGNLFYIAGRVNQTHPTVGNVNCIRVNIFPVPYGGVGSPAMMVGGPVSYYSENWSSQFDYRTVYVYDPPNNDSVQGMFYVDSSGNRHEFASASEVLLDFSPSDVPVVGKEIIQANTYSSRRDLSQITLNYAAGRVFTDYAGGFPIFNSYEALKKGLDGCTKMEYMPGYTGGTITKNTVTQQEINDYSTTYNYYYGDNSGGSGSGSGSGSGGGSSGNWVESIINGLGSFFDGILTIVGKFIELIGKLVDLITKAFADLLDIVPSDFASFLTALFPMVPEEWIMAGTLFITLALLGVLIKLFTK